MTDPWNPIFAVVEALPVNCPERLAAEKSLDFFAQDTVRRTAVMTQVTENIQDAQLLLAALRFDNNALRLERDRLAIELDRRE